MVDPGKTAEAEGALDAVLSEAQAAWVARRAREQAPEMSPRAMLGRVVDDAMARHESAQRRRQERLEVYRASGYAEHHPDYPRRPRGQSDV